MKSLHSVTFILLIVGGLAWGLHAFGIDIVDMLGSQIAMIVYILVGLSAVYEIVNHKNICKNCEPKAGGQGMM
jgi:uncharacterized membrane protein YuzA (DUF378 family)